MRRLNRRFQNGVSANRHHLRGWCTNRIRRLSAKSAPVSEISRSAAHLASRYASTCARAEHFPMSHGVDTVDGLAQVKAQVLAAAAALAPDIGNPRRPP